MKTSKIVIPFLLFAIVGIKANAQTTFGVRAGVNFSNINGEQANGQDLDYKIKPGFNAGVNVEIPVAEDFYLQPGLLFSLKGGKADIANDDVKTHLGYLELPVNFIYKPALGTGRMLLGVGPYVAYGIAGKVKTDNNGDFDVEFKDAPALPPIDKFYSKPFDAGANVLVGYEFANNLSAQLNAQLGLVNTNAYNTDAKLKNTVFGISLGYRFGGGGSTNSAKK